LRLKRDFISIKEQNIRRKTHRKRVNETMKLKEENERRRKEKSCHFRISEIPKNYDLRLTFLARPVKPYIEVLKISDDACSEAVTHPSKHSYVTIDRL